jgi:hypothetical protein
MLIDVPVGLRETGKRAADTAAASKLGGRRSGSVFFTPTRPAVEAPNIEDMAKAEWSVLAESDEIEGKAPPKGQDALSGDEGGALAVVNIDNELLKIMPSNNLSVQDGRATSVVGPYRVSVIDYDMGRRNVEVSKTR